MCSQIWRSPWIIRRLGLTILLLAGCRDTSTDPPGVVETPAPSAATVTAVAGPLLFTECAEAVGLKHTYRDGREREFYTLLESLGGGVSMLDYDCDGLIDVFAPGGGDFETTKQPIGRPSQLFRQVSSGTHGAFQQVAELSGVSESPRYSHGGIVGDYNNDGFDDVLVTGYGGLRLLRNEGDGTFSHTESGLETDALWSSSAAWGDVNGDGADDVYVAHYVDWSPQNDPQCFADGDRLRDICQPRRFNGLTDTLFLSDGAGGFKNAEGHFGDVSHGKGLGVVAADIDLDGDLDIYVTNDTMMNSLLVNDGHQKLVESGAPSGTGYGDSGAEDGSMGVDIGDYNGDGLPDIWVTNYENESFAMYRSFNGATFQHVSRSAGISAAGRLSVGWGTVFADFDLDGDEDLYAANGHVIRYPLKSTVNQRPLLLCNVEHKRFEDVANTAGEYTSQEHLGRGVARGDIDLDGDIDLLVAHINQPLALLRNDLKREGNWVELDLIGTTSTRWAAGAWVELFLEGDRKILSLQKGGSSYASTSDHRLHCGLGPCKTITRIVVHWPSGTTQTFHNIPADQRLLIVENRPAPLIRAE